MEWIRRRPAVAGGVGVVALLAVLLLVWVLSSSSSGKPASDGPFDPSTYSASPEPTLATPSAVPTTPIAPPTALPSGSAAGGTGAGFPSGSHGASTSSSINAPGYQGGGYSAGLPKHRLVFRVFSAKPIGTVGWTLLYTDGKTSGRSDGVGRTWSLTRTVYGYPDFGRLFYSSGVDSTPIVGEIYIDGRRTARCSTEGPFSTIMCQG